MAGGDANATSTRATVSSDGTDVVWTSDATDLVPGVTDGRWNVYERDVVTGVTTLVSVSDTGGEPDGTSNYPDVDTSGRYVVYSSDASDIVPGVTGHHDNVYEYDTATGTTSLVSVSTGGRPAAGSSTRPTVSSGGTAVGFQSTARDLVAGDTSSGAQIYVRDMATGATVLASVSEGGAAADRPCGYPVLSADGRHIAFVSAATNLTSLDTGGKHNIFERDLYGDVTSLVSAGMHATAADRSSSRPAISADGQYVAFESSAGNLVPDDTNKVTDVFRMDVRTGTMVRVSVGENGDQLTGASSRPSLSANGQIVGFASNDRRVTGTVVTTRNVYARAMTTGTNYLVSTTRGGGPGSCSAVVSPKGCLATRPAVSGDGAEMIFVSTFTDLAANATTGEPGVFEAPIG
jgi:Tol biopolymer transport system component